MRDHFLNFARYNEWANRRLYDAAGKLTDEAYRRDVGAFFGSLHGTLNHILVGDQIWLRRISGSGPDPDRLDLIQHDDLSSLRDARAHEDQRILAFLAAAQPADFERRIAYRSLAGYANEDRLDTILTHVFNHQTHHRGQAHGILSLLGENPPSLDLIFFQREAKAGAAPPKR